MVAATFFPSQLLLSRSDHGIRPRDEEADILKEQRLFLIPHYRGTVESWTNIESFMPRIYLISTALEVDMMQAVHVKKASIFYMYMFKKLK